MTTTAEAPEATDTPVMPDAVHDGAEELIRTLAAVAGDQPAVYDRMLTYVRASDRDSALGGLVAALVVMFSECITTPTAPGEFAAVDLPHAYDPPELDEFDDA
jgi:hypothetical protein